jgi:predicted ArsR family transcriptional regulator
MSDDTGRTDPDLAGLAAARALAHPSRQAIRGALEAAPAGLSAPELARCVGLKHNVVRKHLRLMQAGGFVEVVAARHSDRGRPAVRFRLAPGAHEGRRELVRLLVGMVVASGLDEGAIERYGYLEGQGLLPRGAGAEAIVRLLEGLGFAPARTDASTDDLDLRLGRCPFAEAATAPGGQLVCILHRGVSAGLAEGALGGGHLRAFEIADPREGRCRVVMEAPHAVSGCRTGPAE